MKYKAAAEAKTEPKSLSRRGFLTASAAAAAGLTLWRTSARSYAQVVGANSAVRLVVVGCNDMGRSQINQFRVLDGVRIIGLCDVDTAVLDRDMTMLTSAGASTEGIARYADVRKVLDNHDVDIVSIATPNHWHALMTVWACQAGKDVYVEKPICHNIWEGRQAVAASRKYNRIVQAGTQWRSMPTVYQTFEWVKAGNLGKIKVSRGFCNKRRISLGQTNNPPPVPATVDYDLWCGPAPLDPPHRKQFHYDWHWFWPTGNGDIGNQGAHQMDLARWVLGKSTVAPTVISVGGRLGYVDDGQTPNTLMAVHDYGDAMIIFEVRGLPTKTDSKQMDAYKGAAIGNIVECEGGYAMVTERLCAAYDKDGKEIRRFDGSGVQRDTGHPANFLRAVHSRKREEQNGELVEGHVSSCLSHLSNISYLVGKQADPDAIKAALGSQPAVVDTFNRFQAHLAANDIKLDVDRATLGMPLKVDVETQTPVDNEAANALATRAYRAPYVVPEVV